MNGSSLSAVLAWFLEEPRALWALGLALPLIAAHLVRRRRLRVVVPFVPLLVEGRGPVRGGGGWRRLAEAAALACRLLALVALALALARPLAAQPPPPVPLVLVLDLDVTVGAREPDGRSRLSHALALARAHVRAHAAGPVSVILAGATPRVLAREAPDREALARLLVEPGSAPASPRLEAAPGASDLASAATLARALAGEAGLVRVLGAQPLPPGSTGVEALGTGTADGDQGFVNLSVRPSDDGPRAHVEATLKNFAPTEVVRQVRVLLGESLVETRAVTLAPGGEASLAVDLLAPPEGAPAALALEGDDAFAADDRVDLWLAPPLRPSVLAVAGEEGLRPYTAALLAALGERIDAAHSGVVPVRAYASAAPRDVTLVDGATWPAGALRPGAYLFLAPLAGALPFEVGTPVERPLVWRTHEGHPLLRDLDLSDAWVTRAFPLVEGPGLTGLAFVGADQPVVAEGERDGVRWIAVGLDPERSDLPVRAALPLLVKNALLRLARAPLAPLPPFVRAGGRLRALTPLPGGPQVRLSWPGGSADARLAPDEEGFRVPPGARGPVEVELGAPAPGADAARPPPPGEPRTPARAHTAFVDLDPARSIVPARPEAALPAPQAERPAPGAGILRLLLLLAALLLVLDLLVSRSLRARG